MFAPVPTIRTGPLAAARTASATLAMRGGDQRASARAEHLQIDVLVARVDRDHDRGLVIVGDQGRGEGGERGQTERGLGRRERNAARRRDADAQAR